MTQHAVGLQTEDGFDPPFDFFDGTFRQSAKFFGEGFIGHGDQLPEQQIAVTVECPVPFGSRYRRMPGSSISLLVVGITIVDGYPASFTRLDCTTRAGRSFPGLVLTRGLKSTM